MTRIFLPAHPISTSRRPDCFLSPIHFDLDGMNTERMLDIMEMPFANAFEMRPKRRTISPNRHHQGV